MITFHNFADHSTNDCAFSLSVFMLWLSSSFAVLFKFFIFKLLVVVFVMNECVNSLMELCTPSNSWCHLHTSEEHKCVLTVSLTAPYMFLLQPTGRDWCFGRYAGATASTPGRVGKGRHNTSVLAVSLLHGLLPCTFKSARVSFFVKFW